MANKYRLLVVDDDPLNTRTLCEIFTLNGYETFVAHSGREALKILKRTHISCLISDIKMPEMNGVELLRAVKAFQPDILFILMTAYSDGDLIVQGVKEGALVTLIKPLEVDRLLAQIAQILKSQYPR